MPPMPLPSLFAMHIMGDIMADVLNKKEKRIYPFTSPLAGEDMKTWVCAKQALSFHWWGVMLYTSLRITPHLKNLRRYFRNAEIFLPPPQGGRRTTESPA